jgi:putative transposase
MKTEYPTRLLCRVLGVCPSGFYAWRRRAQSGSRSQQNAQLLQAVSQIHSDSRQTYGSPRIQQALRQQGWRCGRNRIARLMRQQQLRGRVRRRYRMRTTDSRHDLPVAPNRLMVCPPAQRPNQIWVGDITYIATRQGWLYLAAVLDLYSRKIVGWAMGPSLDTSLVLASWQMAWSQRQPSAGLLFHSDRGSQYASAEFRRALQAREVVLSMSRKANCYDNATMESFWSTLKNELVYRCRFQTRQEASQTIFEFIEVFYNRVRLHSSLGYHSPVDFESRKN